MRSDGLSDGGIEIDTSFIHSSQLHPRPNIYRAPSFSWASVDGEIEFHDLKSYCINIKSTQLDIPMQTPYSRLKHGVITLTGPLKKST